MESTRDGIRISQVKSIGIMDCLDVGLEAEFKIKPKILVKMTERIACH